MALRVVAGIVGLFFLVQGISWLVNPVDAAEALGMPLLDGIGRSTQMGDISGFFVALGAMILLGSTRSSAHWLRAGALMLGSVAVMRTLAWLLQDAALTTVFIGIEVVAAALLLFVASRIESVGDEAMIP